MVVPLATKENLAAVRMKASIASIKYGCDKNKGIQSWNSGAENQESRPEEGFFMDEEKLWSIFSERSGFSACDSLLKTEITLQASVCECVCKFNNKCVCDCQCRNGYFGVL